MIETLKEKGLECTGCEACSNVCPVDAIEMRENAWGFREPHILPEKCIHCNRCREVCPVLHEKAQGNAAEPACYAVMAEDEVRRSSSSGGAFFVFAQSVLSKAGVVYGAEMTGELEVRHAGVETPEELGRLQKSKYVQSNVGFVYREIREKLSAGKRVLFSGTPCQVAGLYGILGGDNENLTTVDIFCHGVPSQKMLRESLAEADEGRSVAGVDFRDKDYGWECLAMTLRYQNGEKRRLSYNESRYEQGFHPGMTMRGSCYDCKFCAFPRHGDLSIGDFWRIEETRPDLADGKGTSAVLVNSPKGQAFFDEVKARFAKAEKVPVELLSHNRITAQAPCDPGRDYFLELYPQHPFNRSVYLAQQGKFDVGLVGNWSYPNYGSELTYYALYTVLKQQNLSVCMVSWPQTAEWKPYEHAQLFLKEPYRPHEILPLPATRDGLFAAGQRCDTYVLGSDQLLNNNLYQWFDRFVQLDWVPTSRKKIAYAASFGCDYIWGSDLDRGEMSHFLREFDAFSTREKSGELLLKDEYGVKAETVLDPVFLAPPSLYEEMEKIGRGRVPNHPYLFAYILDPNAEKETALRLCSEQLGLEPYSVSDAAPDEHRLEKQWSIETDYGIKLEEWVASIRNCSYMITDSFHGMCLAILSHKPFLAICNQARGATRFEEILGLLGLQERLLVSEAELPQKLDLLQKEIPYDSIEEILRQKRAESMQWLLDALACTKTDVRLTTYDLLKPQMIEASREKEEADLKQWENLEDHNKRLTGLEGLQREMDETDRKQWQNLEDHAARLTGLEKLQGEITQTDTKQWQQLEDHAARMDGHDAKLAEDGTRLSGLEKLQTETAETDAKQWHLLEDHSARMDGHDAKLAEDSTRLSGLEKLQVETAETDAKQWHLLEDHAARMDGCDTRLTETGQQLGELRTRAEAAEAENLALKQQLDELREQLQQTSDRVKELSEHSLAYMIWRGLHGKK